MSKFLKLVVNLFLIAAILVAVAILVPPLAGVTTTIVDSSSMDTNLPLGSITYSTGVDVHKLAVGDEVLKESGTSTYAYILKKCDPDKGNFEAVSATDPAGQSETISLRNTVPKVAVMIPYIGYVMIAMRSLEGIIIIALVVVLMIILYILSELWKPSEEDEEENTSVVSEGLDADDESGIDTAAIRAAVEDNIAAINSEDEINDDESSMRRAERKAAKKEKRRKEKAAKKSERNDSSDLQDEMEDESVPVFVSSETENERPAVQKTAAAPIDEADFFGETADVVGMTDDSDVEPARAEDVRTNVAPTEEMKPAENIETAPKTSTVEPPEETGSQVYLREEKPSVNEPPVESHVSDVVSAVEEVMKGITINEQRREEVPPLEDESAPEAQASAQMTSGSADDGSRFRRVKRPTLEELEEKAKEDGGTDNDLKKDRNTGVTIIDYTDLI